MTVDSAADGNLIKQSILEIRRLKQEVLDLKNGVGEPIAVVGVGCEFPGGASGVDGFWRVLKEGLDTTGPPPAHRWGMSQKFADETSGVSKSGLYRGGYLESDISHFDSLYFGIPPKEAELMDPQHRLFLETVWQALENASISPEDIRGSRTGVFCGITGGDYLQEIVKDVDPAQFNMYLTTGNCANFCAGRVSYILDLKGPSVAIDTACSSSLVAVHQGCESIRRGECDIAIVGGVSLMVSPDITSALAAGSMLSSDGRCKTFDQSADGYARGEGCGVIILKRSSDAEEDGNNCLAVIKGSDVQHDGKKSGLTVPTSSSQKRLLSSALRRAKCDPHDVVYVEAHGTGTPLGDPIELEALQATYAAGRSQNAPLYIGSVKTNLGHLEAAAGIAGLIKVVLAISQDEIPPHLNLESPNEHFDWSKSNIEVVKKPRGWPSGKRKTAAVSSFGASGTNAHILIEESSVISERALDVTTTPAEYKKVSCWYKDLKNIGENVSVTGPAKSSSLERLSVTNNEALFENTAFRAVFKFDLSVDSVPTIRQHRIFDKVVLTGSVYLELAQRVLCDLCGLDSCISLEFGNVVLLKPIVFPTPVISLQLLVEKLSVDPADKCYRVKLFPGDSKELSLDMMHSSIDLLVGKSIEGVASPKSLDLQELIKSCPQKLDRNEFYGNYWGKVFDIGPQFRLCDAVWRLDGKLAIGQARPRDFFSHSHAHGLDRNSFTAYLLGLVFKGALPEASVRYHSDVGIAFIGTGYKSCTFFDSLDVEKIFVIASISESLEANTRFIGSATIVDESGYVLCKMEGIEFCTVKPESIPGAWQRDYDDDGITPGEIEFSQMNTHPILGTTYSRMIKFSYLNMLSYDTYPLIGDHTTFDYALFPALGYIHLAISAMAKARPNYKFTTVDNLVVQQPIMLSSGDEYPAQTSVVKRSDGAFDYEILCFSDKKNMVNSEWVLSSSATVSDRIVHAPERSPTNDLDLDGYDQHYTSAEFFKFFWGEEFILGPSYHHMSGVWRKQYKAVGLIKSFEQTEHLIGIPDMPANFLQIYMSLPLAMAAVPDRYIHMVRDSGSTCIAATVDKFVVYDDNEGKSYDELWSVAELRDKVDVEDRWASDFCYYDQTGKLVAEVRGVVFQIMKKEAVQLLKESLAEKSYSSDCALTTGVAHTPEHCRTVLEGALSQIAGLSPSQLSPSLNLGEILDSIMALQLRGVIEDELSVLLPLSVVGQKGNMDDLYHEIVNRTNSSAEEILN